MTVPIVGPNLRACIRTPILKARTPQQDLTLRPPRPLLGTPGRRRHDQDRATCVLGDVMRDAPLEQLTCGTEAA